MANTRTTRGTRLSRPAPRADACPPCPGSETTLSLPIYPWASKKTWSCSEILYNVLDPAQFERNNAVYVATGTADPNKWIGVGGKIRVVSLTGLFKATLQVKDIFVARTNANGAWHLTMYEIFTQGLTYADKIMRERDPNGYGIYSIITQDWANNWRPGTAEFKAFVDQVYDEVAYFVKTGYGAWASSFDEEVERYLCGSVSTILASIFGSLIGDGAINNWQANVGGVSTIELCLVAREYDADPRTTTADDNLVGIGDTCLNATFPVTESGRLWSADLNANEPVVAALQRFIDLFSGAVKPAAPPAQ